MTSDEPMWDEFADQPIDYVPTEDESPLVRHAKAELSAAGLFKEDSDYDGMLGKATLELIETFAKQGHSGFSAALVTELFHELAQFKPLSPLTNNPDEWMKVHDGIADEPDGLWQNTRNSKAFSHDGGRTHYNVDDPVNNEGNLPIYESVNYNREKNTDA